AEMNSFLQEHLTGIQVIRLFGHEDADMRDFERINRELCRASLDSTFYYAVFYPAVELIGAIGVALIVWYGGGQIIRSLTTIGTLIAFVQLTRAFFEPVSDVSDQYNNLQAAMASAERILDLLDEPIAIRSPEHPVEVESPRGRIEFRNVSFAY